MNFDLGLRVLWLRKLKTFKIIFPLSSLMTSFLEDLKPNLDLKPNQTSAANLNRAVKTV